MISGGTVQRPSRYREAHAMTTEAPYRPPPQPPAGSSPTEPPRPPSAGPVPAGPPWGDTPPTRHGQLMVAYPELMNEAGRSGAPSWIPVVVFTFFFGPLGAISAARRAGKARRTRNDRYPYWVAFAATWALGWVLSAVILTLVALPAYLTLRESATTAALQSSLVHDGQVKTPKGTTVKSAACTPATARANGLRTYTCALALSNGRTASLKVVADDHGGWKTTK